MAWETPKTNWHGATDADGNYVGDRFNAVDFNRMKNNLDYLREMAVKLYNEFSIAPLGTDRTPADYFYADEINALYANLDIISQNSVHGSYGFTPWYVDNGRTPNFDELNMLEGAILDIFDKLTNQFNGRRMFTWNFGMKEGL